MKVLTFVLVGCLLLAAGMASAHFRLLEPASVNKGKTAAKARLRVPKGLPPTW